MAKEPNDRRFGADDVRITIQQVQRRQIRDARLAWLALWRTRPSFTPLMRRPCLPEKANRARARKM